MRTGDIVCVLGGFDNRVRQKDVSVLVFGTLDSFLAGNQVMVLLLDGEIWVGDSKFLRPRGEQE